MYIAQGNALGIKGCVKVALKGKKRRKSMLLPLQGDNCWLT
jgi:hypothetical protein